LEKNDDFKAILTHCVVIVTKLNEE